MSYLIISMLKMILIIKHNYKFIIFAFISITFKNVTLSLITPISNQLKTI